MIDEKQLFIQTEEKKVYSCAFTGHRDLPDDFDVSKLYNTVESLILKGVCVFYNGMAMGFDLLAAECVLAMKEKYPHIKLFACIPCYNQEKYFSESDKERYLTILKKADEQTVLSNHYFRGCMQVRDRYMADNADVLIAFCRKQTGGTAFTVNYFQKNYPLKEIFFM